MGVWNEEGQGSQRAVHPRVSKQVNAPRNGVQSFEMSQVSESEVVYLHFLKFDR